MALKLAPDTSPSEFYGKPCGMFQGVDKRDGCEEALGVTQSVAAISADLGGSSKYSSENLEGRSGERFHENSI